MRYIKVEQRVTTQQEQNQNRMIKETGVKITEEKASARRR